MLLQQRGVEKGCSYSCIAADQIAQEKYRKADHKKIVYTKEEVAVKARHQFMTLELQSSMLSSVEQDALCFQCRIINFGLRMR